MLLSDSCESCDIHTLLSVDEEYWTSGYVMTTNCTPTFLNSHAVTLLTAGKALNLLRLCYPKVMKSDIS